MRNTAFIVKPLLFVFLLSFTSCGVWDFFAAYFNTYYNAKRLYDEAVEEVWIMPDVRESGRNMLIIPAIGQATRTKFTSVIEKCSKLLQYHPESNLVDDALLMIGRSYYYQADYQQADRKFNELIEGYPESNLVPETKVLQAYAYYRIQDKARAEALAAKVLEEATAEGDSKTIADISLLLGQLALDAEEYTKAREFYAKVGEMGDLPDKRAQAFLKVAEIYDKEGDYAAAGKAYTRARSLSGSYIGEYRGYLGAARMLAKQGAYEDAVDALIDLRENNNYREFFGEVDVEIGHVYRDQGDLEAAIEQYRFVDTAYARTESAANANFALGMIYENTLHLYDSAKVAYDRGRNAPPQALVLPLITRKADYLGRYLQYNAQVARLDSTLNVAVAYADSVKRVGAMKRTPPPDSVMPAPRGAIVPTDSTAAPVADAGRAGVPPGSVIDSTLASPVTQAAAQAPAPGQVVQDRNVRISDTSDAAAGQAIPAVPQQPPSAPATAQAPGEGKVQSESVVSPPPAPDTRGLTGRAARTRGRTARPGDEPGRGLAAREEEIAPQITRADSLKPQAPPQPPENPDTVRKHLAVALDNLAGVLYVSMGKSDSARTLYRRLASEFPGSPVTPRALYVLARIEGEDSTTASTVSDSLYRILIDRYPASEFADEARRLIGIPPVEKVSDMAEGSYARATQLLKGGKTQAAIDTFKTLAKSYPQSPAASRALYAAGWTYENQTPLRDSAAAVYERLVTKYPNTPYAQKVQPRVQEVLTARRLAEQKQKELEQAKADSLAKVKAAAAAPATGTPPGTTAPAVPAAPPDTLKARTEETDRQEQLLEERRKARAKPAKPADKPTKPAETPAESPTKPAETPAESPTKPAETPAESPKKPAETPAEKPTKPAETAAESPTKPAETPAEKPID